MSRFRVWRALARAAWLASGSLAASTALAGLGYAEAEQEALARSAALASRSQGVEAAERARVAAGRLPDPRLVLGLENVPVTGPDAGSLTADSMTMRRIGVMQDFPSAAKRRAAEASADATIRQAEVERRAERLAVRRGVGLAWVDRYYAERRLALMDALADENQLLETVVRAQIAAGKANALDVLAVEQERAAIDDRRDELEHELHAADARLARYVGERAREPLQDEPPALADVSDLGERIAQSPQITMFEPLRALASAEVQAADAARRPDWSLELGYGRRASGFSDMLSVQVTVDLPLFLSTRQGPRLAARQAELARVDAEREERLRELQANVEETLAQHQETRSRVRRMRQLTLALADRRVETALEEYRAARIELPRVVDARRERIEARMKLLELEQRASQAVVRLNTITEREMP